jgi:hypothetical protein
MVIGVSVLLDGALGEQFTNVIAQSMIHTDTL